MTERRLEIGTVTLVQDRQMSQQYEVALWHQTGTAKAGQTSPLILAWMGGRPYWALYGFDVEVETSNFSALFAGNVVVPKINEEAGNVIHVRSQLYSYDLAHWLVAGPPAHLKLEIDPTLVEVRTRPYSRGPIAGRWFGCSLEVTEAGLTKARREEEEARCR